MSFDGVFVLLKNMNFGDGPEMPLISLTIPNCCSHDFTEYRMDCAVFHDARSSQSFCDFPKVSGYLVHDVGDFSKAVRDGLRTFVISITVTEAS